MKMICRLCLDESPNYLYIYRTESEDHNERDDELEISEIIWKYIQIQIRAKDTISNTICRRCWQQLYDFHQFCLSIIEKQEVLEQQQHQIPVQSPLSLDTQSKVEEDDVDFKNVPLYQSQSDDKKVMDEKTPSSPNLVHRSRRELKNTKGNTHYKTDFKEVFAKKSVRATLKTDVNDPLSNEKKSSNVTKKQKTINMKKRTKAKGDALFEQQIDEKSLEPKDTVFADCLLEASTGADEVHKHDDDDDDDDDFTWPMKTIERKTKHKRKQSESDSSKSFTAKKKRKSIESNLLLPPHMVYTDADMDNCIAQQASLKCCLCEEDLLDFHHLKRHFRDIHQCDGYVNCCKKRFRQRTFYVDHLKSHLDPNFISCVLCNKPLSDRNSLRLHLALFHPQEKELKFECKKCSLKFVKDYMRRRHIQIHHPSDEDMKFKCNDCGLKFSRVYFLRQHVKEKHKPVKEKKHLTKPQQCIAAAGLLTVTDISSNYNSTDLQYDAQNLYNFNNSCT